MKARTFLLAGLVLFGMPSPANSSANSPTGTELSIFVPSALQWGKGPQGLPAGAKSVVLEGDPSKPGQFTLRLKLPAGYRIPPHWHPNVEHITVLEGGFQLGHGERFDPKALREMPPGSFAYIPKGHRHFAVSTGESIIQLHGIGPWEIHYVNPADDPRGR
ncbi:cupin domain-containing protein [bacterium]|nr:cupin domain-containing protein [bacterium]